MTTLKSNANRMIELPNFLARFFSKQRKIDKLTKTLTRSLISLMLRSHTLKAHLKQQRHERLSLSLHLARRYHSYYKVNGPV